MTNDATNPVEAPTRIHFMQMRIAELEAQIAALDTRATDKTLAAELREKLRRVEAVSITAQVALNRDIVRRILTSLEGQG